jgi:sterol desaturase/sphingolipid hydroxylase (fatty acid hydroxylase superfamily)
VKFLPIFTILINYRNWVENIINMMKLLSFRLKKKKKKKKVLFNMLVIVCLSSKENAIFLFSGPFLILLLLLLLLGKFYLNTLGKYAKILKSLFFFFFFFFSDNLLHRSIEMTIKSLPSKFFNSRYFRSKRIVLSY